MRVLWVPRSSTQRESEVCARPVSKYVRRNVCTCWYVHRSLTARMLALACHGVALEATREQGVVADGVPTVILRCKCAWFRKMQCVCDALQCHTLPACASFDLTAWASSQLCCRLTSTENFVFVTSG